MKNNNANNINDNCDELVILIQNESSFTTTILPVDVDSIPIVSAVAGNVSGSPYVHIAINKCNTAAHGNMFTTVLFNTSSNAGGFL